MSVTQEIGRTGIHINLTPSSDVSDSRLNFRVRDRGSEAESEEWSDDTGSDDELADEYHHYSAMRNSDLAAEARRQGLRGPIRVTAGTRRTALLDFLTQGSLDRLPECDVRTPGRGRGWERGRGRSHGHGHGRGRGRGRGRSRGRGRGRSQRRQDQRRPAIVTADPEPEVARDNAAATDQFLRMNEPTPSSSPRSAIGQFLLTNGPSTTSSQQGGAGRGRARTTPAWMSYLGCGAGVWRNVRTLAS